MKSKYPPKERRQRRLKYLRDYAKNYQKKNIKKIRVKKEGYYLRNKEKIDDRNKEWHRKNKSRFKEYLKEYYSKPENQERRRINSKRWYESQDNKKYREHKRKWENQKKKDDLQFRIKKNLRLRINQAFKKYSKTGKVRKSKDYEIDYDKIVKHLQKSLPKDYLEKEYHIDHITPCCSFDLTNPEQVKICFSPENHQWLLAEDNRHKVINDLKMSLKIKNNLSKG